MSVLEPSVLQEALQSADISENIAAGFVFQTPEDAALASQEEKRVLLLRQHLEEADTDTILGVYNKAIADRVFKTPVGISYVSELRQRLLDMGKKPEELALIPLFQDYTKTVRTTSEPATKRVEASPKKDPLKELKNKHRISVLLNIALVILVIGMFFIAKTSDNPNVINYENALVDKYSSWEQELQQREEAVRVKEHQLRIGDLTENNGE